MLEVDTDLIKELKINLPNYDQQKALTDKVYYLFFLTTIIIFREDNYDCQKLKHLYFCC